MTDARRARLARMAGGAPGYVAAALAADVVPAAVPVWTEEEWSEDVDDADAEAAELEAALA